jgi:DNA-binding NtrC family response regulator
MTKVLVVDDELLLRDILYESLTKYGYEVISAADADKALEMCEKHNPDVALVDIKLPNIDGIELTRRLKVLNPDLQIIIITGYPSLDTVVDATKHGAVEYVIKPFRLDEMHKTIQKLRNKNV